MKRIILLLLMPLFLASVSVAGTVTLAWEYKGTGHKGFRVYYGHESRRDVRAPAGMAPDPQPYESVLDIMDPSARRYDMVVDEGTWYFRMVTIGELKDSQFTADEVQASVGLMPPSGLRIDGVMLILKPTRRD